MELDITEFFNAITIGDECRTDYSASVSELGHNAADITWNNAKSSEHYFVNEDNKEEIADWFLEFGAWADCQQWPINELNGLLIQFMAGDIGEYEDYATLAEYRKAQEEGQVSGRLYFENEAGKAGKVFFYVGN